MLSPSHEWAILGCEQSSFIQVYYQVYVSQLICYSQPLRRLDLRFAVWGGCGPRTSGGLPTLCICIYLQDCLTLNLKHAHPSQPIKSALFVRVVCVGGLGLTVLNACKYTRMLVVSRRPCFGPPYPWRVWRFHTISIGGVLSWVPAFIAKAHKYSLRASL